MTVTEKLPTTRGRIALGVAGAGALWWAAFWVNARIWDWLLYDLLGMDPTARLTETLRMVTVARSFMSVERTRALLGGKREGVGNVMAAGLGVVTPFCSCSAVPAFIGFVAAGVPIGVTLSFLIASPLANEVAIGLLWSLFGWQTAAIYVVAGVSIAIVAGWILGRLHVERWSSRSCSRPSCAANPSTLLKV